MKERKLYTGGSCLSQIFWDHENLSGLSVIWLVYIKLIQGKGKKNWQKIWARQEFDLTVVQLKQDPPVVFCNIEASTALGFKHFID